MTTKFSRHNKNKMFSKVAPFTIRVHKVPCHKKAFVHNGIFYISNEIILNIDKCEVWTRRHSFTRDLEGRYFCFRSPRYTDKILMKL
jgi:hypothetical protein